MKYLNIAIAVLIFVSCNNAADKTSADSGETLNSAENLSAPATADTVVGKKDVSKIIPGSEYLVRAMAYIVIARGDTSSFKCHFSQWKADSTLFFVTRFSKTLSYRQHLAELKRILAEADKDFDLGLLKTIGIGRLVETGDLAVDISKQYFEEFGDQEDKVRKALNELLLRSALARDFNALLKPYHLEVAQVITEKQFFVKADQMSQFSRLETVGNSMPTKVIDCITYLKVKKT